MSKKRDKEYGPKPQDVPLKQEYLPQSPAKMPSGYCKKAKAEHTFELVDVYVFKILNKHKPGVPRHVAELWNWKTYQCTICGKKKRVDETYKLDGPAPIKGKSS